MQARAPTSTTNLQRACDAAVCWGTVRPAGQALGQFWQRQRLYDPQVKPYKSLADLLESDPLFWANRVAQGTNTFTLRFGELITGGGKVRACWSWRQPADRAKPAALRALSPW